MAGKLNQPNMNQKIDNVNESIKTLNQSLSQNQQNQKKVERWAVLQAFLVPIATVFTVCLTLAVKSHWEYKQQLNVLKQQRINTLYNQLQSLQEKIDGLYKKRNELMAVMSKVRAYRNYLHYNCSNEKIMGPSLKLVEKNLFLTTYDLPAIGFSMTGFFNNNLINEYKKFTYYASLDDYPICSTPYAHDNKLREKQRTINTLALITINENESYKNTLKQEISCLEIGTLESCNKSFHQYKK